MVAVPEASGVHWKTCSGEVPELPQLPACVLVPVVVPLKVPPAAGIGVGPAQAAASVVVVVEVETVVVAPGGDLGPARAASTPQVEDGVEGGAGAARLDGRRARDRRRPLEDLLGRGSRAAAAAGQRARAARCPAEGSPLRGDDGRAGAPP